MKNLNTLVDEWIGKEIKKYQDKFEPTFNLELEDKIEALQDLKSRKQELVEEINSFYYDQAKHEQEKFLDGFSHPDDCKWCNKKSPTA